jgi:glycosyltransferase involved in cell wall biosynthesis
MIKLLAIGDAGVNTGFERVVRGILNHLHETGEYEITLRGISYPTSRPPARAYPYTVLAADTAVDDPLGVTHFAGWIEAAQPDLVFIVQDCWNITNYLAMAPKGLPTVGYYPVDCPNVKWIYALGVAGLTEPVTYTQFAARESAAGVQDALELIRSSKSDADELEAKYLTVPNGKMQLQVRTDQLARLQNLESWNIIPHGMEQGIFYPMEKVWCRKQWGIPPEAYVILNVGTNQPRKRQDLTIRAFAQVVKAIPDALLVLHCQGGNRQGWDLLQLARYYGVAERVICTHLKVPDVTDEQLRWLYNAADVQVNTSGGEGWGLPIMEGAACGVPQVVPDWSATRELWRDYGALLPIRDVQHLSRLANTVHCIIDVDAAAEVLIRLREPAEREPYGERALARVAQQLTWPEVGEAFHQVIKMALNAPPPTSWSLRDIRSFRKERIYSESSPARD